MINCVTYTSLSVMERNTCIYNAEIVLATMRQTHKAEKRVYMFFFLSALPMVHLSFTFNATTW